MAVRDLFLPSLWNGRPLFTQHRVSIYIDDLTVHVVQATVSGSKTTLLSLEEYQINPGELKTYHQRLGSVLKRVGPKIPAHSFVTISYPSSKVVAKELTLPFLDEEQLKMVVEYEIEPVIPFKLENAVIDFTIVNQSEVKSASTLLVVAAQKEEVKKLIDIFNRSDIEVHRVTVDVFGLATLFSFLPQYEKLAQSYIIVDVGALSTRISLISKHTLIAFRTINHGSQSPSEESDYSGENEGASSHITKLFDEIAFTISSFELKYTKIPDIEKVFFEGPEQLYTAFETFGKIHIHKTTELLASENIAACPQIKTKIAQTAGSWHIYSKAIGLILDGASRAFSLRKKDIALSPIPDIVKSLTVALGLFLLGAAGIGGLGYLDLQEGNAIIEKVEKRELSRLRAIFPDGYPGARGKKVKALAAQADQYLSEQEELWSAFNSENNKPLEILQELGLLFNRKKYNVSITQVVMSDEEQEAAPIQVSGTFKSKSGKDDFKHFNDLEHDILEAKSSSLTLAQELDPKMAEKGNGVTFVAQFKQKEAE